MIYYRKLTAACQTKARRRKNTGMTGITSTIAKIENVTESIPVRPCALQPLRPCLEESYSSYSATIAFAIFIYADTRKPSPILPRSTTTTPHCFYLAKCRS